LRQAATDAHTLSTSPLHLFIPPPPASANPT
jgi:hypothetical protein